MLSRHTGGQLYLHTNCAPEQRDQWSTKLQVRVRLRLGLRLRLRLRLRPRLRLRVWVPNP